MDAAAAHGRVFQPVTAVQQRCWGAAAVAHHRRSRRRPPSSAPAAICLDVLRPDTSNDGMPPARHEIRPTLPRPRCLRPETGSRLATGRLLKCISRGSGTEDADPDVAGDPELDLAEDLNFGPDLDPDGAIQMGSRSPLLRRQLEVEVELEYVPEKPELEDPLLDDFKAILDKITFKTHC